MFAMGSDIRQSVPNAPGRQKLLTLCHDLAETDEKTDQALIEFPTESNWGSSIIMESEVSGSVHQWITSFLTQRTQQIIVDGAISEKASMVSGVPHGTV